MLHFGLGLGLVAKLLDDLGINKKDAEYDQLAHFHRLYKIRTDAGDDIPHWVHDIYNASLFQHIPLTKAIQFLQNKEK